jgi:hypothetical protein
MSSTVQEQPAMASPNQLPLTAQSAESAESPISAISPISDTSSATQDDYKGYLITVTPFKAHDDLWDFSYSLALPGGLAVAEPPLPTARTQSLGGHASPDSALLAGLEVARTEIDNRLAMNRP